MARKAASKTQDRTPRQVNAPDPVATQGTDAPRRGRKPKQSDVQLSEPALADLFMPAGVEPGSEVSAETVSGEPAAMPPMEHGEPTVESKLAGASFDDVVDATGDATPAKARRGRRPKAQLETGSDADPITDAGLPMMDAPTEEVESIVSAEQSPDTGAGDASDDRAKTPPATRRRARARKPESNPQSSAPQPEQRVDEPMANLPAADQAQAGAPEKIGSAVHWSPDTVTFDWPAIEQVAAAEGPNRGMAKLLLAALAEGANSRWPF